MTNINEDYIQEYLREIIPAREEFLVELENYAEKNHVPIIEPEVAQLLRTMLKINKPKSILELGTAIGYSSIVMASEIDTQVTTIERRADMVEISRKNIARANLSDKIIVIEGDAEEVLEKLTGSYDMIFLDAAKGQYKYFFDSATKLLNNKGIIISDNVLFKGMVASDDLVIRRKKTIVKRLREYLIYINNLEGYTSCVLPIGDGVAITYREE